MTNNLHATFKWDDVARVMITSRTLDDMEESVLYPQGLVLYQFSARGHELGQVLLSQLLTRPGDSASVYYRSRPFILGSGLTVEESLAGGLARAGSVSAGRDVGVVFNMPSRGKATILPMAGDVGSQYTPAAGWAQALQYKVNELGLEEYRGSIAIVSGGDGSVATNGFWSALTMATTLKLPLLFIIEDNGYAISVVKDLQTPGGNIADNLASFQNLKIWQGSGTNPAETADLVANAVDYVRQWQGPGLLRLKVPRLSGHSSHDNQSYKSEALLAEEWQDDPLPALRDYLVPSVFDPAGWEQLVADIEAEVAVARDSALAQPNPDAKDVTRFVWSQGSPPQKMGGVVGEGIRLPAGITTPNPPEPRRINLVEAVRRTLDTELALNPRSIVFGEDVGHKGGVHTATMGLQTKYGQNRVFDTSLSEEGIIGRAVGMALAGLSPSPEIQFRKYADPATEQLHNCGTLRWRTANNFAAPIVVRVPGGFGRKVGDPWHSVTGEVAWAHAVGWQIAFPSNAEDAVGLLRSAMRGNDPVIFFEHRAQMDAAWARRPYPGDEYVIPFGQARFISTGNDLTIVSWGAMVERCEQAAQQAGGSIEIIDLRTIVPWDKEAVLTSVRKTSKVLIVHEDISLAGFGAEVSATIGQEAFMDLDAPIQRMGAPAIPVPFNYALMQAVVPSIAEIRQRIEDLLTF